MRHAKIVLRPTGDAWRKVGEGMLLLLLLLSVMLLLNVLKFFLLLFKLLLLLSVLKAQRFMTF
jgi:hypothetical protein